MPWPIWNEVNSRTDAAWRRKHEEPATIKEVMAGRRHALLESIQGVEFPMTTRLAGIEHLMPISSQELPDLLVIHVEQVDDECSLHEFQQLLFAFRGPSWQGSDLVRSICQACGFKASGSQDWQLLSHVALACLDDSWVPSDSVLVGLADGWPVPDDWYSADDEAYRGPSIVRRPEPFRFRTLAIAPRGVTQVIVVDDSAEHRERADHLGNMLCTHYLDIILLHMRIQLRTRTIERTIAALPARGVRRSEVEELASTFRHLRTAVWTTRPSAWPIANRLYAELQEESAMPARIERLREDMAELETSLERQYRSRIDGLLLVIAMVSVVASIATITGVALAYWQITQPGNPSVGQFAFWWAMVPGVVFTTALGVELSRRRLRGRNRDGDLMVWEVRSEPRDR
jgi:hypothetical protein